jgi:methylmalonyl-CoA/ethylmalonyl-CoA epimerase
MNPELKQIPGFLFFDHVAISVKPGELEANVSAYRTLGFQEVHREDVLGNDQVREVLLQVGDGPHRSVARPPERASPFLNKSRRTAGAAAWRTLHCASPISARLTTT